MYRTFHRVSSLSVLIIANWALSNKLFATNAYNKNRSMQVSTKSTFHPS